ncbi:MAG: cysteine desulfurase family protein [Acidimicrobiia bacterium]|nr:MAG: cysteine desulfurase family protein [Acidimicrobiia bacterium]
MTIYLDHAATTTIRPVALEALDDAIARFDRNASGQHAESRLAKNALEEAREQAATLLGTERPHDIVFTGSGTESDNLAIIGASLGAEGKAIAVSEVEHKAVLKAAFSLERFGYTVERIPVSPAGLVAVDLPGMADRSQLTVLSVMLANNEIGTIQPVREIAANARLSHPGVVIHTDAVQAFNSHEVTLAATGADLISLASHKFGGPKGVGLLAIGPGVRIEPIIHGGGQEAGRRAGTHNVAGIIAMVTAMEAAASDRDAFSERTSAERATFESALTAGFPGAAVTAGRSERLPHISHIRFPGVLAETLLIRLDQVGIAAAAGSACQSGAVEPSHVLKAIGFTDEASGECIRFSFGWDTPQGEGWRAARLVLDVLGEL